MTSFGLVFKDTFNALGFSATDGSVIINTNAACSMMTGLINGPLLKYFGPRKVSIAGAVFTTAGVILTSFANSFTWFLISYSFITALGMGMGMSSYPYALNLYFVKRRSKAAGIAMTITGLGPVLMPQMISLLLSLYGVQGAMLVIGGVAANSFIAATLLQPVEWHMIEEAIDEENGNTTKQDETKSTLLPTDNPEKEKEHRLYDRQSSFAQSVVSIDHDLEVQAIYGMDTPLAGSVLSLSPGLKSRKQSISSFKSVTDDFSKSMNRLNAQRSLSEPNEKVPIISEESNSLKEASNGNGKLHDVDTHVEKENPKKKKNLCQRIMTSIVTIFDLTLFKDPVYVNIMLGMSLAVFAEINFSLLTPFIMADFMLTTPQIAMFLSVLSIADLCFRFLSPFIGDFLNKPPRIMYLFSLLLLISTRFSLLFFSAYEDLLFVAVALGIAKGIRTVYWTLVIPNYVPIERLANASGIQMVVNGLFIMAGGPLIGVIRDLTGSYRRCIIVLNIVTLTTVLMWTTEMLYKRYKSTNQVVKNEKS